MQFDFLLLIKSLGTGFAVGVLFSLLRLPIPAPEELASVVGVIGIFLGLVVVKFFIR